MKKPATYTLSQAEKMGYTSITISYSKTCEIEQRWLANVLKDMEGVDHCLIDTVFGIEVGRLKKELL